MKVEYVKTGEDDRWVYYDRIVDGFFYCVTLKFKGNPKK